MASSRLPTPPPFDPKKWRKKGRKGQGEGELIDQGGTGSGASHFIDFGLSVCTCVCECALCKTHNKGKENNYKEEGAFG